MNNKYRQKVFFKKMNELVNDKITEVDWEDYTAFTPHTQILLEICAGLCEEVCELKQQISHLERKIL